MGKEDFILPPGVQKGSDYFGQTSPSIEGSGERSAARIRSRMPDGRAELLIIDESKTFFFDLPNLAEGTSGGIPIWVPRYNPDTGSIYTTRWDKPLLQQTDNGVALAGAEKYKIISKPQYKSSVDLASLPKSWTVARLIPQEIWDGIEAALRQQDEIRTDYGGKPGAEQQVIEDLLVGIRNLSDVFREEEITEGILKDVSEESESFLESLGLTTSRGEAKQNIAKALQSSAEPDRRDRVNPMISRIRLRSAYLSAVKREVVGRLIKEKSNKVFEILLLERESTRNQLELSDEAIDWFLNEHPVFLNPENFTTRQDFSDRQVLSTVNSLRGLVDGSLKQVRVAPYLAPARVVEVLLTDPEYKTKKDQVRLERALGVVNMEDLMGTISCEEYVRMRRPHEAIDRLVQAQSVIRESLSDPDNSVYTIFSPQ